MIALLIALVAVHPVPSPSIAPPSDILARYQHAVRTYRAPRVASFSYAVEQDGLHGFDQVHRIYRSGLLERDETLAVDGKTLVRPVVRIIRGRRDRYAVAALAPRSEQYAFVYGGAVPVGHHRAFRYLTYPKIRHAFTVTSVVVDGVHALPLSLAFTVRQNGLLASGTVEFTTNERYWVPIVTNVEARRGKDVTHEHITWFSYRFPGELPEQTFAAPQPMLTTKPVP